MIDLSQLTDIDIERIVVTFVFIGLTLFFYFVIKFILSLLVKRSTKIVFDDVKDGLTVLLRIITGFTILYIIDLVYHLPGDLNLALSLLIGAIITLSSLQFLTNIIAGFYIFIVKPYSVNDFVSIGIFEGNVIKFNLNITKLLTIDNTYIIIQNRNVFKSEIINFSNNKQKRLDESEKIVPLNLFDESLGLKKYIEYSFQLSCPLNYFNRKKQAIEEICEEFCKRFGITPTFFPISLGFKLDLQFIVKTRTAQLLMINIKEFRMKILETLY